MMAQNLSSLLKTVPRSKNLTLSELGKILDLDKSSVSLALRNSPLASEKTRVRVREAALRYGYRPNLAAQRLRTRKTLSIGAVLPGALTSLGHPVPVQTIQGLSELAGSRAVFFQILSIKDLAGNVPCLPDGLMVWGDTPLETITPLRTQGYPLLVVDPNHLSYSGYRGVTTGINNKGGARTVVKHLLQRGAKHLLFALVCPDHLSHRDRWEGAHAEWVTQQSGESVRSCVLGELSDEQIRDFVRKPQAAIFCSNDFGAIELWHRLNRLGIQVPQQVLLAGFDGEPYGALIDLTTAICDCQALAQSAFTTLLSMIEEKGKKLSFTKVPVSLQVGKTT